MTLADMPHALSEAGGSRGEAMRASSSSSMRSAQMVHPLMDSVLEEDDYVIVDPAPSPSSSGQTSRSRYCACFRIFLMSFKAHARQCAMVLPVDRLPKSSRLYCTPACCWHGRKL